MIEFDSALYEYQIANYTVGLCKVSRVGEEERAEPVGTATLIQFGSVYGLLTAAHVLAHLPDQGNVPVVRFPFRDNQLQKQVIDMSLAEKVILRGETFGPEGPDLGFLRLPPASVSSLKATNSFVNVEKVRDEVLDGPEEKVDFEDVIFGVVEEWTESVPVLQPNARTVELKLLAGFGEIVSTSKRNGFDFYTFEASYDDDFKKPESYGGVSGGGLWRIFVEREKGGDLIVLGRKLIGVAFYQLRDESGAHTIVCHGPIGIYSSFVDELLAKWPDSARE